MNLIKSHIFILEWLTAFNGLACQNTNWFSFGSKCYYMNRFSFLERNQMLPLQSSKKKESKKERKGCNLHEMGLRPFGHSTCSTRRERGSPLWTDTQNACAFFHLESRISVYNTTNQPDNDSICMPLTMKLALVKQENVLATVTQWSTAWWKGVLHFYMYLSRSNSFWSTACKNKITRAISRIV